MSRVVLVLVTILVSAAPAAAGLGVNGRIAWDRAGQIWTANQDGSDQRDVAAGTQPAWSPDGRKIAFVAGPAGTVAGELMVMNAEGSGVRPVEADLGPNVSTPSWSPDGMQNLVSAFGDVYAVPVIGGRSRLIVRNGQYPAWSPDGSWIAFTRNYSTIYLVRPDGSDEHPLLPPPFASSPQFSWSPDGKRIAFQSYEGIDAVNVDGSGRMTVVPTQSFNTYAPAWSPDRTRIAFISNADICTAGLGGTAVSRLTWTPISIQPTGRPVWQPLAAGSVPAGIAGFSAGPPLGYLLSIPWYPGCDRPDDDVAIYGAVQPYALVDARISVELTVRNAGSTPLVVDVFDQLSGGVPGPVDASQGACGRFERHATSRTSECRLGGLLPGGFVDIRIPVVPNRIGAFTNVLSEESESETPPTSTVSTQVVRCTLRGTSRSDRLHGTRGRDVVCGGAGNDRIDVRGGGNDVVFCGPGRDTVLVDEGDWVAPDCERVGR
jgi:TolB protein